MKTIALTFIAAAFGFAQTAQNHSGAAAPASQGAIEKTMPLSRPVYRPVQRTQSSTQKPEKTAAAKKQAEPVHTIPEGAKLVEPNLYRFTDSEGKTWMYRQTPFGISRWEDTPNLAPHPAPASVPTSVTDLGDSFRFERKTAFGTSQWVRKKTELSDEEKALVANQQEKPTPVPADKQAEKKASGRP